MEKILKILIENWFLILFIVIATILLALYHMGVLPYMLGTTIGLLIINGIYYFAIFLASFIASFLIRRAFAPFFERLEERLRKILRRET